LRSRVEKSLRINASIAWPACAVLASLSTPIIAYIFTAKWYPAQPILYAYCVTAMMTAVGVPLSELFFSQNDAWFNLRLCLWWTIPTWTIGTYAVLRHGLVGWAIFQAVLQTTWFIAFLHARRTQKLHVFTPMQEPLIWSAILAGANLVLVRSGMLTSIYRLVVVLAIEAVLCAAFLVRMLMSWRSAEPLDMGAAPNQATI
jgi:O-antigen/teichoic acid export membrane protein